MKPRRRRFRSNCPSSVQCHPDRKDDGGKSYNNVPPDAEGDDFVIRTPKVAK